ncbi:hypothetical protein GEMRC1_011660 [Eukaryota sp. GEM-RC1]
MFWLLPISAGLCSVAGAVYTLQTKALFLPKYANTDPDDHNPSLFGIPYQEEWVPSTHGVLLNAWFLKSQLNEPSPVICFFHGNAGNIATRCQNICHLYRLFGGKINIFIADYRGYGKSNGNPSELGLYDDGIACIDWLKKHDKVDSSQIFVFGRSLGGAVAIKTCRERPVAGLVVENTFSSVSELLPAILPGNSAKYIPTMFVRCNFPSIKYVPDLTLPFLVISGDSDELIPPEHSERLYAEATKSTMKQFVSIKDGSHNETWLRGGEVYDSAFKLFVYNCLS